ncbi:MAG: AbrB family transcriptional regulator [Nocardioides sp.]
MSGRERTSARAAALVVIVTLVSSVVLEALQVPSAVLFGAVLGGMAHGLTSPSPLAVPPWAFRIAQGLIGITVGALVDLSTLRRMASDSASILTVMLATLGVSVLAGRVLALRRDVTPTTGVFAMIAGGASGVVAVARDLGADDRVVTVVQYLRVLLVLVTLPVVTALVFHPAHGRGSLTAPDTSPLTDLLFVAISLALGLLIARVMPATTMTLIGPMVVAAVLAAGGWLGEVTEPTWVQWIAFALIGVQVGLRFTRASLAAIGRMLPVVLLIMAAMIGTTAGLGALLAWLTPVDGLTAYLATTPGGLFAVLATAADAGSDVTYVLAFQLLRLLLILALLPILARWLRRFSAHEVS